MQNPWNIISLLEADNSRLAKEAVILAAAKEGNSVFFQGCQLALDAMVTFGLKQISEKTADTGTGLSWEDFTSVVAGFTSRNITGHAARDAVNELMNTATKDQWNLWYRRILIKDLRCGVSEKTINNVVKSNHGQFVVPVFTCQLAHDSANHETKVQGQKLIEVKLDGVRVITVVYPNGHVSQYSRNGKELVNFEHIKQQISAQATTFTEPMVLDGEVMSTSFQDLMKQVHRKSDVAAGDAVLHLFDMITLSEFQAGQGSKTQLQRSADLLAWYENSKQGLGNVAVVGQEAIDLDTEQGQQRFKQINSDAITGGYEGLMIKDPQAVYECKRTASWLKLKPFIEVSLEVISVEQGTGRNQGRLGAFVCQGIDDGRHIGTNVGSGFTDSDRDVFWNSRDSLVGQIVEVRADAVTQNQDGSYSLRFPRFLRFRGFEPGEKL